MTIICVFICVSKIDSFLCQCLEHSTLQKFSFPANFYFDENLIFRQTKKTLARGIARYRQRSRVIVDLLGSCLQSTCYTWDIVAYDRVICQIQTAGFQDE